MVHHGHGALCTAVVPEVPCAAYGGDCLGLHDPAESRPHRSPHRLSRTSTKYPNGRLAGRPLPPVHARAQPMAEVDIRQVHGSRYLLMLPTAAQVECSHYTSSISTVAMACHGVELVSGVQWYLPMPRASDQRWSTDRLEGCMYEWHGLPRTPVPASPPDTSNSQRLRDCGCSC